MYFTALYIFPLDSDEREKREEEKKIENVASV
jgi:hypothetical protein